MSEALDKEQGEKMREMIAFFASAEIPKAMRLSQGAIITDTKKFIDSHVSSIRTYWKKESLRETYYERLVTFYELIKTKTYEELDIEKIATIQPAVKRREPKPTGKKPATRRR